MVAFASAWWKGYCNKKLEEVLETPDSRQILDGSHVLLTFVVGGAVLISQLLLQTWPATFAGVCLLSPALAVAMLSGVAITAWPSCQGSLPVLAGGTYAGLTAFMSVSGAIFHLLPFADNRAVFTLINTLLLTLGVYLLSRKRVPEQLKRMCTAAASGGSSAAKDDDQEA